MIYVCTDIELYCGQIKGAPNRSHSLPVNQINCLENQHVDLSRQRKRKKKQLKSMYKEKQTNQNENKEANNDK